MFGFLEVWNETEETSKTQRTFIKRRYRQAILCICTIFVFIWTVHNHGIECWPSLGSGIGLVLNANKKKVWMYCFSRLSVNFQRIAYNTALWKFSTGEDCHCWEGQHQMICWSPNSHTRAQNKQLKLDIYSPMLKYKHIHSFEHQYQCLAGPGDTDEWSDVTWHRANIPGANRE